MLLQTTLAQHQRMHPSSSPWLQLAHILHTAQHLPAIAEASDEPYIMSVACTTCQPCIHLRQQQGSTHTHTSIRLNNSPPPHPLPPRLQPHRQQPDFLSPPMQVLLLLRALASSPRVSCVLALLRQDLHQARELAALQHAARCLVRLTPVGELEAQMAARQAGRHPIGAVEFRWATGGAAACCPGGRRAWASALVLQLAVLVLSMQCSWCTSPWCCWPLTAAGRQQG
jgi:hypothetical protein